MQRKWASQTVYEVRLGLGLTELETHRAWGLVKAGGDNGLICEGDITPGYRFYAFTWGQACDFINSIEGDDSCDIDKVWAVLGNRVILENIFRGRGLLFLDGGGIYIERETWYRGTVREFQSLTYTGQNKLYRRMKQVDNEHKRQKAIVRLISKRKRVSGKRID